MNKNNKRMSFIFSFFLLFTLFSGNSVSNSQNFQQSLEQQQVYSYMPLSLDSPILQPGSILDTYRQQNLIINSNVKGRQQDNKEIIEQQNIALQKIDTITKHFDRQRKNPPIKPLRTARGRFRRASVDTIVIVQPVKEIPWFKKQINKIFKKKNHE